MFKGLTRTLVIVTAALVALPAVILMASGGPEWVEKFGQLSPFF